MLSKLENAAIFVALQFTPGLITNQIFIQTFTGFQIPLIQPFELILTEETKYGNPSSEKPETSARSLSQRTATAGIE